jgi:hypothetical protein
MSINTYINYDINYPKNPPRKNESYRHDGGRVKRMGISTTSRKEEAAMEKFMLLVPM